MRRRILFAGESRGTAEVITPLAKEFARRGDETIVFALGTATEAEGFDYLPITRITKDDLPTVKDRLVGCDLAIVGATGRNSLEWEVCGLAKANQMPVIALLDNIDNLAGRLPSDRTKWADLFLVSGQVGRASLDTEIRNVIGSASTPHEARFQIIENLRQDRALHERASMTEEMKGRVLSVAMRNPGTRFPPELDRDETLKALLSGTWKLVIVFTQNIEPQAPYWNSYGKPIEERRDTFNRKLSLFLDVTRHLLQRGAIVGVRSHPGETEALSGPLSQALGCIFLPRDVGDSMRLAMAAGYMVTPPSSMVDQGPLYGIRTAALLCQQPGPHHYEALAMGAAVSADHLSDVSTALDELLAEEDRAAERWNDRLTGAISRQPAAPAAADHIFQWAGWHTARPFPNTESSA